MSAVGFCLLPALALAAPLELTRPAYSASANLADLSLEQLANLEVTSVSKKAEKLSHAPAAIHVITGEDIRRSGFTSIPEALRLAPGLQVARIDAHTWAISARGFNDVYANKLLVLMDGRSVYTPLFAGVFWDMQDTLLEDLDRIEVIRGPGATLWGANAVNGVINITTRSARQTQGLLLSGGGGTEEHGFGAVRYGGQFAENAHYRVYGKFFNRDDSTTPAGTKANDDWQSGRGGFRADWEPSPENILTVQGDYANGVESQTYMFPTTTIPFSRVLEDKTRWHAGNLLGRWSHTFPNASDLRLQAYYDFTKRETDYFNEDRNTLDTELQYHFAAGPRHDLVAGAGYRFSDSSNTKSNFIMSFMPAERATHLINAFVQDEITLWPDRLELTVGTKVEHNDYTGLEIQPSGRLLWTPHPRHSVWASVSRAVHTPSRAENDMQTVSAVIPGLPVTNVTINGNAAVRSEVLLAYELGYRVQPHDRLTLDLTAFYNDYHRLRSFERGNPNLATLPAYLHIPAFFANNLKGETYGAELAAGLQVSDWWRWHAAYTYLQVQLHTLPGSKDFTQETIEGDSPHHQVSLRSSMDLPHNLQLDCLGRYVDNLPSRSVRSYVSLDVRLGWNPTKNLELALVGQNLLDGQHAEFATTRILVTERTEVERAVYGKVTWRY